MMSSLFTTIAQWVRERGQAFAALNRKRRCEQLSAPPVVEVLEARCLPTSTTTVPPMSEIAGPIVQWDIALASQSKGNPLVVFVGDSISWQYAYGTGAPVWASEMATLDMANFGVGGQTTQSLLFQFSQGQLVGIDPRIVVLDIGANNLLQGNTPQETTDGVLADVSTIHQYLPSAHVIVLGIFPGEQSPNDPYRSLGAQTNQLVSQKLASDPNASFVNLGSIFVQPNGTISSSMMFDYLHPSTQGYQDLTNALLPILEQALLGNFDFPTISAPASPPSSPIALTPQ